MTYSSLQPAPRSALLTRVLLAVLFAALSSFTSGCVQVEPGEAGVKTSFLPVIGGVKPRPIMNSYTLVIPGVHQLVKYDVRRRAVELRDSQSTTLKFPKDDPRNHMVNFNSKDGQSLWAELIVDFSLDPEYLPVFHQNIGPLYFQNTLEPRTINDARNVLGLYSAYDLITGTTRLEVQETITKRIQDADVRLEGLTIYKVLVRQIIFNEEFQRVIEESQVEQQRQQLLSTQQKNIEISNENLIKAAEGSAKASIEEAKGRREVQRVVAEGQAETFRVQAEFLKAQADALQGGANVAAYELAKNISDNIQIYGIPTGGGDGSGGSLGALGLFALLGLQGNQFLPQNKPMEPRQGGFLNLQQRPPAPAPPTMPLVLDTPIPGVPTQQPTPGQQPGE